MRFFAEYFVYAPCWIFLNDKNTGFKQPCPASSAFPSVYNYGPEKVGLGFLKLKKEPQDDFKFYFHTNLT